MKVYQTDQIERSAGVGAGEELAIELFNQCYWAVGWWSIRMAADGGRLPGTTYIRRL